MIDLDGLEAKARAATKEFPHPSDRKGALDAFSAAANPAAVLELVGEVRRLRRALEAVDDCCGCPIASAALEPGE